MRKNFMEIGENELKLSGSIKKRYININICAWDYRVWKGEIAFN